MSSCILYLLLPYVFFYLMSSLYFIFFLYLMSSYTLFLLLLYFLYFIYSSTFLRIPYVFYLMLLAGYQACSQGLRW